MSEILRILARRVDWDASIHILICERDWEGRNMTAIGNVVMEKYEPGAPIPEPSVRLDTQAAQVLMDELWSCGLRPTEGSGSAGALSATQRHLEDMRKLVFRESP